MVGLRKVVQSWRKEGTPMGEVNGSVVIVRSVVDDIILMLLNNRSPQKWNLPGGGIGLGELPVDAGVRELGQETGVIVSSSDLTRVGSFVFRERYGIVYLYEYRWCFIGTLPKHSCHEVAESQWMSIEKILSLSRDEAYPAQQALIAHYAQWVQRGRRGTVEDYLSAPFVTLRGIGLPAQF